MEIERVQRPFWAHQLVEYLVGIALISVAVQQPQPALPALLGAVVLLNAAVAEGAAGAFRLVGRRLHRILDLVVVALLVVAAVQPWVSLDNVGRLVLGGVAFVLLFVWFHTDFTERAPRASRSAGSRTTSENLGRNAGRLVGGGVNSLKRWKAGYDAGRRDDAATGEGPEAGPQP